MPFVEKLELPLRRMPNEVRAEGSALCVSDGPSLAEYDPADLNTAHRIYAYGRTPTRIQPHVILLLDRAFEDALAACEPCEVRVPHESVYGAHQLHDIPAFLSARTKSPLSAPGALDGFSFKWAPDGASVHGVLNAVADGCQRIFLLGFDGYLRIIGTLRVRQYWESMAVASQITCRRLRNEYYAAVGEGARDSAYMLIDSNLLNWNFSNRAVFECSGMDKPIWGLGPSSRHALVWDTHPDVINQEFGRIDRQGPAAVIYICDRNRSLDCDMYWDNPPPTPADYRGPLPIPKRSRWGSLHVHHHIRFISRLREEEPKLAIYVLADTEHARLAAELPPDIQVADIDKTAAPEQGFHSYLSHYRLPPVAASEDA